MTERPDLGDMWRWAFDDDTMRIHPRARYAILHEERCNRPAQHLQLVVFKTAFGRFLCWRAIRGARDVWAQEWLDEAEDTIYVTCHCDRGRRVNLSAVRLM